MLVRSLVLALTLPLTACGIGVKVAGDERDGASEPDRSFDSYRVDLPVQPLHVVVAGGELQTNDVSVANVSRVTAAFTFAPEVPQVLTVRVTKLRAVHCPNGHADLSLAWRVTGADGQVRDRAVESTTSFTVEPGGEQRLIVTVQPEYGLCEALQLTLATQARPL